MKIVGKKILISGGAGWLGSRIVKKLCGNNELVIYSRDEAKHYLLKKQYPQIKCVIGDVSNLERLNDAAKGCNIGIFLAALKQIEAVEENIEEGVNTIVYGALNSKRVSLSNGFESSCIISSDKASSPVLSYGAAKLLSENIFINNNEGNKTKFSACRYGNVANSKGSILEVIFHSIKNNYIISLYSEDMTRFNIMPDDAIDLIFTSLDYDSNVVIPKLKSFRILDLFEIYREKFGLTYKSGKPRPNEKIHEILFSEEESRRIQYDRDKNIFLLGQENSLDLRRKYSSEEVCMDREELEELLKENNYFNNNE